MHDGEETNIVLEGKPISPGVAIGRAYTHSDIYDREPKRYSISRLETEREYARIEHAMSHVLRDLEELARVMGAEFRPDVIRIFDVQQEMLRDEILRAELRNEIGGRLVNAEEVVREVFHRWEWRIARAVGRAGQPGGDVADLGRRLLRVLSGVESHSLDNMPHGSILVARRLYPSDAVFLVRKTALGVIVEVGGRESHAALLAREMGIPCITGITAATQRIASGDLLMLDGASAIVTVNPDRFALEAFDRKIRKKEEERVEVLREARQPAVTRDNELVTVMANITGRRDAELARTNGADGVGLFRLEQLDLSQALLSDEAVLSARLGEVLEPMRDKPLTIRLLDIGGDKHLPFLPMPIENDPALGRRGIRLLLEYPDLLLVQIRAVVRLATYLDVRMMIPMVTFVEDVAPVRQMFETAARESGLERAPPLGAMIETPAAALSVGEIVRHVDFLAIGTNDLTQFTMAAGRGNPLVSHYYRDSHAALLRLIGIIVRDAGDFPVSVCGELAAKEEATEQLLAAGIRNLSVPPLLVPQIKTKIRNSMLRRAA